MSKSKLLPRAELLPLLLFFRVSAVEDRHCGRGVPDFSCKICLTGFRGLSVVFKSTESLLVLTEDLIGVLGVILVAFVLRGYFRVSWFLKSTNLRKRL